MFTKSDNPSHVRGVFAAVLLTVASVASSTGVAAVTDPNLYNGTGVDYRANEPAHPVYFTKGQGAPVLIYEDNQASETPYLRKGRGTGFTTKRDAGHNVQRNDARQEIPRDLP